MHGGVVPDVTEVIPAGADIRSSRSVGASGPQKLFDIERFRGALVLPFDQGLAERRHLQLVLIEQDWSPSGE
jgi:hypothetical protein